MPFLAPFIPAIIGIGAGAIGTKLASGGGGGSSASTNSTDQQLQQLFDLQKQIADYALPTAQGAIGKATAGYDTSLNFFNKIMSGSDEDLMKLLDIDSVTKASDQNEQLLAELGVRGGARSAGLANASFDRQASVDRVLKQLRFAAPSQIASIAQGYGNIGLGALSAAGGAGAQASDILFGQESLKDTDAANRNALLGGIFQSIGTFAGLLACVSLEGSSIAVPSGKMHVRFLEVGDEVLSFDMKTGKSVIRTVIRKRISEKQGVRIISNGVRTIKPTPTHVFIDLDSEEITCADLVNEDLLAIASEDGKAVDYKPISIIGTEICDVVTIKLDDENDSYPMIINGYVCTDDDPLR
jgi:hypothetical protein